MCVINIKYAGQELPKLDKVRDMFETNPHGAGFMFVDDEGKLIIKKGYFTEEAFLKSFYTNNYLHNLVEKDVVLHFRIATSRQIRYANMSPIQN